MSVGKYNAGRERSRPSQPEKNEQRHNRIYVALDIESSGTESEQGEIIEVAAVRFRLEPGGQTRVLERWQTLVRPRNPIPYKITHLTGIKQSDVERAPTFSEIRERLQSFLGHYPVVGHSIESDFHFLARQEFHVENVPVDTYELATLVLPQMGNYSLVAVAQALDIVVSGEVHRALADTLMAMNVFAALVGRLEELPLEILKEVNRIADEIPGWPMSILFSDAIAIKEREEHHTGAFGNLGTLLKQHLAEKQGTDLEFMFLLPEDKPEPLAPHPGFSVPYGEYGDRVISASLPVKAAMDSGQHLLLEMPGDDQVRALSLLLPAVEVAKQQGQSVVIAANSETQRDRLLNKIVPELQKRLAALDKVGQDEGNRRDKRRRHEEKPVFKATAVKHQNSYLCLRRWENFRKMEGLTPEELKLLIKVLLWLPNTLNGDSAELRIMQQERLWSRVNTQKGLCLASHCQFNQRNQCFYFKARDRAEASHIIVTDQPLVLADAAGQAGTLPHHHFTIIDDAHHLEDEASRQFGISITPFTLLDFLDWLHRPVTWKENGGQSGFLTGFNHYYGLSTPPETCELLTKLLETVILQVETCRDSTMNLLRDLTDLLTQINHETGQGDGRIRLDSKFHSSAEWGGIAGAWEVFKQDWEELYYRLRDLRDEVYAIKPQLVKTEELMLDLNYFVNQSNFLLNRTGAAFEGSDTTQVYWLASHPRTQLASIYSAPLQVDQGFSHLLFSNKRSVVVASSTLTTDGDFRFIRQRLGLQDVTELRLHPERNFADTTMLYLPTDMPEPSQPGFQKAIDQNIMNLAKACNGRMLALFTSNSALRLTYKNVQRTLEQSNILVLGMGLDGTRRSVLGRFKSTEQALLLSTLGHWENAELFSDEEIPLSFNLLTITKLPFDPPSDPVFAARTESKQFSDSFLQYSLPRTILRFKQAYERLLDAMPGRGAVVILDSRLTRRSYGPTFLNSLPSLHTRNESLSRLIPEVRQWLGLSG